MPVKNCLRETEEMFAAQQNEWQTKAVAVAVYPPRASGRALNDTFAKEPCNEVKKKKNAARRIFRIVKSEACRTGFLNC